MKGGYCIIDVNFMLKIRIIWLLQVKRVILYHRWMKSVSLWQIEFTRSLRYMNYRTNLK